MVKFWRVSSIGCAGLIALFSLLPSGTAVSTGYGDKVEHFASFFALAIVVHLGWTHHTWRQIAIVLISFGALIELAQTLSPGRHPDLLDWAADAAGVAAGLCAAYVCRQ